jgi:hypothetical protein
VAGAWITLQLAYRDDVEIRVDHKTAQLEGAPIISNIQSDVPSWDFNLHRAAKRGALDALEDAMED